MDGVMRVAEILERLKVPSSGATVFFHISVEALGGLQKTTTILEELNLYFDKKSTICMPSYPFSGAGYTDWAKSENIFDVHKTPSRVNLITEVFRRSKDVKRSVHPWCSVACKGYLGKEFTAEHHLNTKTFGQKSPFYKISESDGIVVGLGVNCNTNSFAHMPDDIMLKDYNFDVYEKDIFTKRCMGYDTKSINVYCDLLESSISKKIRPILMREYLLDAPFYNEVEIEGVNFYSMNIKRYTDFSVSKNTEFVKLYGKPLYYAK